MIILYLLPIIIGLFLAYVATRPAEFSFERSRLMDASQSAVYAQIADFRNWEKWSPWLEMEPNAKLTYGEKTEGVGGHYRWDGNKTGSGGATWTELSPESTLKMDLNFEKPMKANNKVVYSIVPEGDKVRVTWHMSGVNGFGGKLFGVLMSLDKMLGPQFDRGLELLETASKS